MEKISFYYRTANTYSSPVREQDFLLRCIPQNLPEQEILDLSLYIDPLPTGGNYGKDSFGNTTYTGRLPEEHTFFSYWVKGTAVRDDDRRVECEPLPIFSYPSILTGPSPMLQAIYDLAPKSEDALEQADYFRETVYHHMTYVAGVTNVRTTANQAALGGQGVCQDFTHIFLALCRMKRIPARYVSGLPVGEGASHAWAEVWYKGRWYGIDATRNCRAEERYIKFCTGRDFIDCPMEQGVFWGWCTQAQTVYSKVDVIS